MSKLADLMSLIPWGKKPDGKSTAPERVPQRRMHIRTPDGAVWEFWMRPGDVAFPFQNAGKWMVFVKRA